MKSAGWSDENCTSLDAAGTEVFGWTNLVDETATAGRLIDHNLVIRGKVLTLISRHLRGNHHEDASLVQGAHSADWELDGHIKSNWRGPWPQGSEVISLTTLSGVRSGLGGHSEPLSSFTNHARKVSLARNCG